MSVDAPSLRPLDFSAAILAGGKGSRLRPAVSDRPKVLAEVQGRPFLTYQLDQLADAGFRHVVLLTGYLASQIERTIGTQYRSLEIEYSVEPVALGTGGALRLAQPLLRGEHTLLLNGDSYFAIDLRQFINWHCARPYVASLALTSVPDSGRYGQVSIAGDRIVRFAEKSSSSGSRQINAGLYMLRRGLVATIPPGRAVSLERECFPRWLNRGLGGFESSAEFIDIGLPETYAQSAAFFRRNVPGGMDVINSNVDRLAG